MSLAEESPVTSARPVDPAQTARRSFRPGQVVASLRHRNYRLFFFGQLVSVMGTWMESVAQSFLVLDLTHSGTALGLTLAVRFLPMLLFGPMGGLFADRRDKQKILYVTQTLAGLVSAVFAILIATGSIRLWIVYLPASAAYAAIRRSGKRCSSSAGHSAARRAAATPGAKLPRSGMTAGHQPEWPP